MNNDGKTAGVVCVVCALLALMAVLAGGAALRESVTVDEVAHIGSGVSALQRLDLRLNGEHPPLPKVLAALPLVLRGVRADYTHISWNISEKFFPAYLGQWVFGAWLLEKWNEPQSVLAWARLPMLLLALVLGWAVFVCAKRLGGAWGGLLCVSVYASTPVFLTFGPIVHTDIAVTLFTLLTLWTFAEVWREPSPQRVALFGLSLAGALLSKFTAGILLFAFAAFASSLRWRAVPGQPEDKAELRDWRRGRWRATRRGIVWAALAVYVFYLVFSWHQPTNALYRLGDGSLALMLRRLLLPAVLYLRGVFWVLLTSSRSTFLLGHAHPHGVWFYYPVVFALKSTLGFLGLLALAVVVGIVHQRRSAAKAAAISAGTETHWRVLWVSLLVFTAICLLSPLDISIRHFSIPIILLILLLAPLPRMLEELHARSSIWAVTAAALCVVLAASSVITAVRAYPFYFPYMNALSFGQPAYALVNDSNVDWNQSLPEVKCFAEQHGLSKIGVDAYGFSNATVWVPQAAFWDCQTPAEEDAGKWVAVSANMIYDGHNCGWLLKYPREPLAGGSMYALQLPAHIPAAGSEGGPPERSSFREFGGAPFDLRRCSGT